MCRDSWGSLPAASAVSKLALGGRGLLLLSGPRGASLTVRVGPMWLNKFTRPAFEPGLTLCTRGERLPAPSAQPPCPQTQLAQEHSKVT